MWIYYFCSHGPGHQSQDDGFKYFPDDSDKEDVKEYFYSFCGRFSNPVISWWKVDKLPQTFITDEVQNTRQRVANLNKYIKLLNETPRICISQTEGMDETIKRNLTGAIREDVIKRLHRAGIMVDYRDLSNWWWGKKKITNKATRDRVLRIIRRSKRYGK